MNEAETRAEHIDPALKAAGWGVVEGSRILREYPITLGRHRRLRPARQAALTPITSWSIAITSLPSSKLRPGTNR